MKLLIGHRSMLSPQPKSSAISPVHACDSNPIQGGIANDDILGNRDGRSEQAEGSVEIKDSADTGHGYAEIDETVLNTS